MFEKNDIRALNLERKADLENIGQDFELTSYICSGFGIYFLWMVFGLFI